MNYNEGKGKVIQKNTIAIQDTLARGYLQACRHANGRDWWIIVPEWNSNCYYTIYLGPEGISSPIKNCSGPLFGDKDFGAEVSFSPDGNWYARSFAWGDDSLGRVELYSFDRCAGSITHYSGLNYPVEFPFYTGISFSPNSNYLYTTTYKDLWQFDLSQQDVQGSIIKVGEIDEPITSEKGSLYFQQLTPNGEIFIASPGNHYYLSSIQMPNKRGLECGFKKHNMKYPENQSNWFGLPNYPNYRLGPVDGSQCDSLGINNVPIAKFKYELIPGSQFDVNFTNLSYFEPDTFIWDFGDLHESNLSDPMHHFNENKSYTVCLTAINQYGEHTFCRVVDLADTISAVNPFEYKHTIEVRPNPFQSYIDITLWMEYTGATIDLFSALGELVYHEGLTQGENSVHIPSLPDGLYFYQIRENGTVLKSGKIVKSD